MIALSLQNSSTRSITAIFATNHASVRGVYVRKQNLSSDKVHASYWRAGHTRTV